MAWVSITMSNLASIQKGTLVAPANPDAEPENIYSVIHVSEPETGEYTLESNSFGHPSKIQKKTEQFLKDNWWVDL